jgi:phosphocarrier protein
VGDPLSREVRIVNRRGLHARAAARFVREAERFDAEIRVARDDMEVVGTSILGLMMLAASNGTALVITATGMQAADALAALADLIERRFDEED